MLLTLSLFALTFATSCDKEKISKAKDLEDTEWVTHQSIALDGDGYIKADITMEIDFHAKNTFDIDFDIDLGALANIPGIEDYLGDFNMDDMETTGTWRYEHPKVFLTMEGQTIEATVTDTTLTFTGSDVTDNFGEELVFNRVLD